MKRNPLPEGLKFHAFISHSWDDEVENDRGGQELAKDLQESLRRLTRRWYHREPFLSIARDEEAFAASSSLEDEIYESLDASDHLVLLLSPIASRSDAVNNEVSRWIEDGDRRNKITYVVSKWRSPADNLRGFAWGGEDTPAALSGEMDTPLAADLREFSQHKDRTLKNHEWRDKVAFVAAGILNKEPGDFVGAVQASAAKARALTATFVLGALVLVATAGLGLWGKRIADRDAAAATKEAETQTSLADAAEENARVQTSIAKAAQEEATTQSSLAEAAEENARVQTSIAADATERAETQTSLAAAATKEAEDAAKEAERQQRLAAAATEEAERQQSIADAARAEADLQLAIAAAVRLANASAETLATDPTVAALLALEAVDTTRSRYGFATSNAYAALHGVAASPFVARLEGHTDGIRLVALSPDGSRIASVGNQGDTKLWDSKGDLLGNLGQADVSLATFSSDGSTILTAGIGVATVWDRDGTLLATLPSDTSSAALGLNGAHIATIEGDAAKVWTRAGALVATLPGATDSVAFSPDGSRIITTSGGNATLWEREGTLISALEGHQAPIISVDFSPDGSRIVTASTGLDGIANLSDGDGVFLKALDGSEGPLVEFSPDGSRIVTGAPASEFNSGAPKVWDRDGALISTLDGHGAVVFSIEFNRDGDRIVTAGGLDGLAKVWTSDGLPVATIDGHSGEAVLRAGFSPDGSRIVTTSRDETVKLWDATLQGGITSPITTLRGHGQVLIEKASFSPDGSHLLSHSTDGVGLDGNAIVWRLNPFLVATLPDDSILVAFSPDGSRLVTTSTEPDSPGGLWDRNGTLLATLPIDVASAEFSPDGSRFVTTPTPARLWDHNGTLLATLPTDVSSADFSPDGSRIVTTSGGFGDPVRLWDSDGIPLTEFIDATSATFSPDGSSILASSGATISVLDLDGTPLATIPRSPPSTGVFGFNVSPDGSRIITNNGLFSIDGRPLVAQVDRAWGAAFSPDSSRIATIKETILGPTAVEVRNRDGAVLTTLSIPGAEFGSTEFSPDGSRLITVGFRSLHALWDIDGTLIATLRSATGIVGSASFSPDGTRILTLGTGGVPELWDGNGVRLAAVGEPTDEIESAAFSPDGSRIVTTDVLPQPNTFAGTGVRLWATYPLDELVLEIEHRLGGRQFTAAECARFDIEPCAAG